MDRDNLLVGIQQVDVHVEGIPAEGTLEDIPQVLGGNPEVGTRQVVEGIPTGVLVDNVHVPSLKEILCQWCLAHHACPSHLPFSSMRQMMHKTINKTYHVSS